MALLVPIPRPDSFFFSFRDLPLISGILFAISRMAWRVQFHGLNGEIGVENNNP